LGVPEIKAIPDNDMAAFHKDEQLKYYVIYLKKLLRFKPYILSEKEERLLAMKAENENASEEAFSALSNVDMSFGELDTAEGPTPLTNATWHVFMENPERETRKRAYERLYGAYENHQHTIASLYAASVKNDVINARIRGFSSARAASLFPDKVPESVYDNLLNTINANLEPLHRYYRLRKKALGLQTNEKLRHYDVYVPLLAEVKQHNSWNEAVDTISAALAPLGSEYVDTLRGGLLGRWCDRYENKGKRSGAFSAGGFTGDPYILMSFQEDSISSVFTLAHEGGHSMHSWYAARNNPFMHYSYSIFEAEVASTFNEELLFRHLLKTSDSRPGAKATALKTWLINSRVDEMIGTLYRQTMFAEFEKRSHELEESGTPLNAENLRAEYRRLLEKYFGPDMAFEETSDLEGLRIPHFYSAFYVYKYSTGISAALALAERVLSGGEKERDDYFAFLKSGGSRFPIDSLKVAGVDMSSPEPINAACKRFAGLVHELENALE
jgi:oligoendopeptidase F